MTAAPIKCQRPSRCRHCGEDIRRGDRIVYTPATARPGQPRHWIHEECA